MCTTVPTLPGMSVWEYAKLTRPSNVSLDEVRAVWETNVFAWASSSIGYAISLSNCSMIGQLVPWG